MRKIDKILQKEPIYNSKKDNNLKSRDNMQRELIIPSFNHSLTQSRKQRNSFYQHEPPSYYHQYQNEKGQYNELQESGHKHNRRLFDNSYAQMNQINGNSHTFRATNQYWQQLYQSQSNQYKNLLNKHTILLESISLHHQALSLKNTQSLDSEQRLDQIQSKIKSIQRKASKNEQKITKIAHKCQQIKVSIDQIHHKVNKEEAMAVEEDKYVEELEARISRITNDMDGLRGQLSGMVNKEQQYEDIVKQNQMLQSQLYKINSEANIAKIKIEKDVNEEESTVKKMRELQKIIKGKQKTNRQLGKKLFEIKKLNPEVVQMGQGNKGAKLKEIVKNIREMEQSCSRIQSEIYDISDKIQSTTEKLDNKVKTIQMLRRKQQKQQTQVQEADINMGSIKAQNKKITEQAQHKKKKVAREQQNKGDFEIKENRKIGEQIAVAKKPVQYRVIQSEQSENMVYGRGFRRESTGENEMSLERSGQRRERSGQRGGRSGQRGGRSGQRRERSGQRGEKARVETSQENGRVESRQESGGDESMLQINESLKNLVNKFYKYKSNSLFKH